MDGTATIDMLTSRDYDQSGILNSAVGVSYPAPGGPYGSSSLGSNLKILALNFISQHVV